MYIHLSIYICVCVCVSVCIHIYIYIYGFPVYAFVQTLLENEKGNMGLPFYIFKIILKLHSIIRIP